MKIEIKHRFSQGVLFSYERENNSIRITLEAAIKAKADLRGADLRGASLRSADLRLANLRLADLRLANLRLADLRGADLIEADLRGATGNTREVISFQCFPYYGVYTAEYMQIGCYKYPVNTFFTDSEKRKAEFSESDIEWRNRNKHWIQAMVKANPAVPTGHEGTNSSAEIKVKP